uniref:p0460E08.30 protein n=1 Tax=Oryza sativa subsp. japonica TaxID=39947 RepID=Q94DR8_ORYSJ|nr:P0460E08.30 [Oryza sativa Japonica Group]
MAQLGSVWAVHGRRCCRQRYSRRTNLEDRMLFKQCFAPTNAIDDKSRSKNVRRCVVYTSMMNRPLTWSWHDKPMLRRKWKESYMYKQDNHMHVKKRTIILPSIELALAKAIVSSPVSAVRIWREERQP